MRTTISLTMAALGLLTIGLRADDQGATSSFKKNRAAIEKLLNGPLPLDRATGLRDLKQYPVVDAMKMALPYWPKDPNPEVRGVAADVIYGFKDEAGLRAAMFDAVKKEVTDANSIYVAAWLAGTTPDDAHELLELLGKMMEKRP